MKEVRDMILEKWWNYCRRHGYIYQQPSDVDIDEQKGIATLSNINGTLVVIHNYEGRSKFVTDVEES